MVSLFVRQGWFVFAGIRNPNDYHKFGRYSDQEVEVVQLDVSNDEHIQQSVKIVSELAREGLDCLINNAGFGLVGPLESLSAEQIRYQMAVNFTGATVLTKACLPLLRQAKGRIINISSVCGYIGFPLHSLYCASKHALDGLTESLYHELKPHGIQVASVQPGAHRSQFGQNLAIGEAIAEVESDNIYKLQHDNLKTFREKLGEDKNATSLKVAEKTFKLASQKQMPLHSKVGNDSIILNLIKSMIPNKWFNCLMGLGCQYVFLKKRKAVI